MKQPAAVSRVCSTMYARAVEEAAITLRDLRRAEWEDLALGLVALGSAIAATTILPSLAIPLFLGGVAIGARGLRALWLRWDLVERLAGERDAYVISEVRDRALRETTMGRRRAFAAVIRTCLCDPENARLRFLEAELEDLAAEFGVSRERVRQIEVRAFEKVQRAVKSRIAAMETRPAAPVLQAH